ncbi:MAG: ubiquinol oxidase subunit II [Pseudomonadota bacterium]
MDELRKALSILVVALTAALSGCELVVLDPAGDVATQQGQLIVYSTVLMLIVIVPVMALTIFFALHYRASNKKARYEPEWDHSISLEIVVWSVPLAIISCLAGLTWVATHRLDPYEPLRRISADVAVDPEVEPLQIQVVALDWKWLFIYPEQGIATVNEVAAVVDRPIEFQLTSDTVMNSFYVPALSGMIYAMAGMQTELNAVINEPGTYRGFSANYSGAGFSQMRFDFKGLNPDDFDGWVKDVKESQAYLSENEFVELARPSVGNAVEYYTAFEPNLWDKIVNMCAGGDALCQNDMMMVDALGGGGLAGLYNRDLYRGFCSVDDAQAFYLMLRPEMRERSDEILAAISNKPTDLQAEIVQAYVNGG